MNILNKEELKRQIREGKEVSTDGILDEFKSLGFTQFILQGQKKL